MPMQFNKIPDLKTVTEIQFRYRCHHFETMTSKKFRQGRAPTRAPKRTQKMCPNSPARTQLLEPTTRTTEPGLIRKTTEPEMQAKAGIQMRTKTDTKNVSELAFV